ncbi:hypothetical protein Leryth_018588 [Lithospermum erythrorhizon]|nr:hypothetical protein Leryth_018588 [Lithospermum erythrorhizon]
MAEPQRTAKATSSSTSGQKNVKAPNLIERAKEEAEAIVYSPPHDKETHGKSDVIDESTPVAEVKAPGVFQRAKEEIEAVVEAIVPPKK